MIPASELLKEAVRNSNTMSVEVDVYRGGTPIYSQLPVRSGSVSFDRGSKVRSDAKVSVAMRDDEASDIDCYRCRLKIFRGAESIGVSERQQIGEYRINSVDRSDVGTMTLDCSGLEVYLLDARFLTPRTPPYGSSTVGTIRDLIIEILPGATVIARNTYNKPVAMTSAWDTERWDAIDALAASINAEVFCNYQGYFIIQDQPSLITGVPVMVIDEGPGGVLVGRKEVNTRDQVYNAVSVSGESTDPEVPPVWGWAYDDDPNSPTYYYGDFGQVPRFYTSKFLTTEAQCRATAVRLLADALAENRKLSFTTVPISFLEVNDLAAVDRANGSRTVHLLDALDFDLGPGGSLDADTRSTKVEARET